MTAAAEFTDMLHCVRRIHSIHHKKCQEAHS